MTTIYLDFETYYASDYTLSKLSTEAYVRDPQFKCHGFGIAVNDEPAQWFSDRIGDRLQAYADHYPDATWVAHNALFDGFILSERYGIKPERWVDTLQLARLLNYHMKHSLDALTQQFQLGQKGDALPAMKGVRDLDPMQDTLMGNYCRQDVELTRKLLKFLLQALRNRIGVERLRRELDLIDLTTRMYTDACLLIEPQALHARMEELEAARAKALQLSGVEESVLMSNQQFSAVLAAKGVQIPGTFRKTDSDFLELQNDPRVADIVKGRLAIKSVSELRRIEKFIGVSRRGTLPVPLKYHGAHTGRWSGSDGINLQNLNRGSALRRCITAPDGYNIIATDSSQIEARTLAWLADERELLLTFAAGGDVYTEFARKIWPGQEIDKARRFIGKTCILGLGYGTGAVKLHATLTIQQPDVTEQNAADWVQTYRQSYRKITALWRTADQMLRAMMQEQRQEFVKGIETEFEAIRLPSGRWLNYPGLRLTEEGFEYGSGRDKRRIYGAALVENLTQGIARDVVADQMLAIAKRYRVAAMVHDEVVFIAPVDQSEEAKDYAESIFRTPPKYAAGIPLNCESDVGRNYS